MDNIDLHDQNEAASPGRLVFILIGLAGLTAIGFGTGSFELPKWIVWHTATLCIALWWLRRRLRRSDDRAGPDALDILSIILLIYVLASSLWAPDIKASLIVLPKAVALFVIFHFFRRIDARQALRAGEVVAGIAACVALVRTIDPAAVHAGFGNINDGALFVLFVLPLLGSAAWEQAGWRRYPYLAIFIACLLYLFIVNPSLPEYPVLLFLPVFLAGFVLLRQRRYAAAAVGSGVTIGGFGFLLIAVYMYAQDADFSRSVLSRIELTVNTLALWFNRPLFGNGIGSFGFDYARFREFHMTFLPGFDFTAFVGVFTFADAAHNEYAQFLAETGLVGAILMALILIAVLWRAVTRPVLTASDVVALCIVAIALVSASLNFPIQKPATSALAFAALGILARKNDTVLGAQHVNILPGKVHRARLWAFIAFLLLWSGVSYGYVRAAVAAGIFVREFQAHIAIDQKAAYQGVIAAHGWFPLHPVYRLQLFPTLVGLIESDRNAAVTFAEADRAYAISRSAGANEPVLTLARARYLALTGRGGPAEIYALFDRARHNASALPLTHILETRYALSIGDLSRAEIALARARVGAHAVARHFGSSPDQPAIDILSREIEVRMQQLPRPAGRITD